MSKRDKNPPADTSPRIVNRKARHEYHILESLEVGVILTGSEVKSIRNGQVSLAEGFARVEPGDMKLKLYNVDIAPYVFAHGKNTHEPKRVRELLAHKRQIAKLLTSTDSKGATLTPLTMYFVRGKVKIELGLGVGKKAYDKRQDLKKREADRDIRRSMSRRF